MSLFCPKCHHQLQEMKKFCPYCGYHFEVQSQPQKKKGKKGLIILLSVLTLLIVGVIAGAVILYPMIQKSGIVDTLESKVLILKNEGKGTEEEASLSKTTEEEDTVASALRNKLDTGDYEGVIEDILAMQEGETSYDEVLALLPEAVDSQLTGAMEKIDSLVSAGTYTEAFATLEEEAAYRSTLSEDERIKDLVSDTNAIDEKMDSLLGSYQEYVYQEAMSRANNRDAEGVDSLFAEADERLDNDEYDDSKRAVYAKLVVTEANNMNAEGEKPGAIIDYIDDNLSKVENDCWVLELWDFFNALKEYETGNITTSTKVKHVTDGYILPNSDSVYLTDADLSGLSRTELRMARYEIYARHGRIFSDEEVANYFAQYDWYQKDTQPENFQEADLNEYERANRDLLVSYEKFMGYR